MRFLIFTFTALLFLLGTSTLSNAQIADEIRNYVDSTEYIINNGKKLMIESATENDYYKTLEIYNYLQDYMISKPYSAFNFYEELIINLLTENWYTLTTLMSSFEDRTFYNVYPSTINIVNPLQPFVIKRYPELLAGLSRSTLDQESKLVISMILHVMYNENPDEEYNQMLTNFKEQYPDSPYKAFVKRYLPGKNVKAAYSFSFGSGVIVPTLDLGDNFGANAAFSMAMDLNIKRSFNSLYLNIAGLPLNKPFSGIIDQDTIGFLKDEKFHFLDGGLRSGYFLVRSERFHLAPYLSISGTYMESRLYDNEDEGDEFRVHNSFAFGGGLHTEVMLFDFYYPNAYTNDFTSYISLKLEAGYNNLINKSSMLFSGDIYYLNVSLAWGFGTF